MLPLRCWYFAAKVYNAGRKSQSHSYKSSYMFVLFYIQYIYIKQSKCSTLTDMSTIRRHLQVILSKFQCHHVQPK